MSGLLSRIITAWPQIVRRMLANWQLTSTVVVGVLLASSIMSGAIIYFDALRDLALKNTLSQLSVNDTNIALKSDRGPTNYAERDKVARETEREIQARLSWMLRDSASGSKTSTFFLSDVGMEADADTNGPRTFFAHLPDLLEYSRIETWGPAIQRFAGRRVERHPGDRSARSGGSGARYGGECRRHFLGGSVLERFVALYTRADNGNLHSQRRGR